jgi:hypothetical protein
MATHIKIGKEAQRMLGEIKKSLPDMSDRELVEFAIAQLREMHNNADKIDKMIGGQGIASAEELDQ